MKQKPIGFRELLERVLPLDELPPPERLMVQRALQSGVTRQLEAACYLALERLESMGALRRLPPRPKEAPTVIRYQPRGRLEIIALPLETPAARDGITSHSRASLPARAPAGLDQVRGLLQLDDAGALVHPRGLQMRSALQERLSVTARELLGEVRARFFDSQTSENDGEGPLDAELVAEALRRPSHLLHSADTSRSLRLAAPAARRDARSLILVAVLASDGAPLGVLEVLSARPEPFGPEDLARATLLADACGAAVERAARIQKLVFVDALTGVYNRAYFEQQAGNEMARAEREQASLALCIADIDDFKRFNSVYGYEAGNLVLVAVARALRRGVRPFDTVARWGGEEFAVLLSAPVDPVDVVTISERLRDAVQRLVIDVEGLDRLTHQVRATVSVGVALFPEHAGSAADLWRVANQALLVAKRPPKNQVVFYRPTGG